MYLSMSLFLWMNNSSNVDVLYVTLSAVFISLKSILIIDLLGIEKISSAFGLTVLFDGAVIIIGSPLSGEKSL